MLLATPIYQLSEHNLLSAVSEASARLTGETHHERSARSIWRKWDLHVHTPESLVHQYGGDDPWPQFIRELESLPPEFKVIGINDYLFLDGYKRILKEKAAGKFQNIDLSCQ